MFDLHDRLQTLARSLEGVYVEKLGKEERFFYANPDGSSTLFLTLRDDADIVCIRLKDGLACSALLLHPRLGGWTEMVNPTDSEEEALWQAVLASYQAARRPLAQPTGFSPLGAGESVARRFAPRA